MNNRGFTLIEVIVAMVLASMVTLIMALALRVSLQAWERGAGEGDRAQIETALPALLERQLEAAVTAIAFSETKSLTPLEFYYDDNLFTFFTRYSPRGTPRQGLVRVVYHYDEKEKTVNVYEKLIGKKDDIEPVDRLLDGLDDEKADDTMIQGAQITGVDMFRFDFLSEKEINKKRRGLQKAYTTGRLKKELLENSWGAASPGILPVLVQLSFSMEERKLQGDGGETDPDDAGSGVAGEFFRIWLFKVGNLSA